MIGDPEFLNKVISVELADYIKKHTKTIDWNNCAMSAGVSFATVRNLVYRQTPITEGNKDAIIELMKVAIKKRENDNITESYINKILKSF